MKRVVLLCFACFVISDALLAQEPVRIAFWNMENFFDPFVDSTKTYNAKVSYKEKTDELSVRGSLDRAGLLGRSQVWKRKK